MENDTARKSILIAESERYMVRLLKHGLARADIVTSVVSNGDSVLRKLREEAPDILIVDTAIQPMSGEELCRRIQTDFPNRAFLTCVLTDSAEDEYANFAQWFSNFRMLEKPVSLRQLLSHILRHTANKAA